MQECHYHWCKHHDGIDPFCSHIPCIADPNELENLRLLNFCTRLELLCERYGVKLEGEIGFLGTSVKLSNLKNEELIVDLEEKLINWENK